MKNNFKVFIAFVLAFVMMQGVYAASGAGMMQPELRGGSIASGNMTPVMPVTPKPERVTPTPKPTPTPEPFYSDVSESDWYYTAVKTVTKGKLMDGTNDAADNALTFEPNGKLTRAMFVTILYRLADSPAVKRATPTPKPTASPAPSKDKATAKPAAADISFKDVPDDRWYSDAVLWAASEKIADGTDSKSFSPNKSITREQAVVMLYRFAKYEKADTSKEANLLKYKDYAKIGEYAIDAFSWACGMGIIEGSGDSKKLDPAGGLTRAQAAKMVAIYSGDMPKETAKPKATAAPKATDAPKSTATPAATAAPGSTATPAATAAPGSTATPAATAAPGSTATAAPGSTATPAATAAPGSTATPAATAAPK